MKTFFTIILAIFGLSSAKELPSGLEVCSRNGTEFYSKCSERAITSFIKTLATGTNTNEIPDIGLPNLNIPPIEPLVLDAGFYDDSSSIVSGQEYSNITLYGLTELVVDNFEIDLENQILYSEFIHPRIDFVADYRLQFQILGIPIVDNGRSNISLINVDAINVLHCQKYVKDGEAHVRVIRYETRLSPESVILQFNGIFGSGSPLGNQLKLSLARNSDSVFTEMIKRPFEEYLDLVLTDIANHYVFDLFPMKTLFPEL